jgi:type I restriction enzyme S subunit
MSDLPHGWTHATIEQLAGGQGLTTDGDWIETKDQDPNGDVRLIQLADIGDGEFRDRSARFVTTKTAHRLNCTFLEKDDLLIARMPDPLGRACIFPGIDQPAITAVDVFICRPSPGGPLPRWLMYFVNSRDVRSRMAEQAGGTTRQRIAGGRVKQLEQQRITVKVDSLSGKSKRAREQLDHVPRLVDKYKQAILAAAFRGDLTRQWRKERRDYVSAEELEALRKTGWQALDDSGRISGRYHAADTIDWRPAMDLPSNWVWASLDQVSCLIQYGTSAKTTEDTRGVAVLRMGNIQDGTLDLSSLKFLPEDHDEFPNLLLERGDILFNRTNSAELVGKSAVYFGEPERASFASYLIRIRCSGLLPELLSGYINSAYGREWVASVVSQQVGQANVNGTKLRQLGIPVMPRNEQREIARRVEAAFRWIDRLASEAINARKLIDHLNQAVLVKAFQGELVPQDPTDEPASVLLERIRSERQTASVPRHRQKAPFAPKRALGKH